MLFDAIFAMIQFSTDQLYPLGDPPDYEPTPDQTVAAIAERRGQDPLATMYDLMLESDAGAMLMLPFFNYAEGNHDAIYEMMSHPAAVSGLSDGGAHCGMICDASYPTYLLTHWARDRHRGPRFSLEYVVRKQTLDTATLFGLSDRGVIQLGKKADFNVIDIDALNLRRAADGLRPARRWAPAGPGRERLRRHGRQRCGDPAARCRHRCAPGPADPRGALRAVETRVRRGWAR